MANDILTKTELEAIREGLHHYFGPELGLPDAPYYNDAWRDSNGIFKWKGREDFLRDLSRASKYQITLKNINRGLLDAAEKAIINAEATAPEGADFKGAERAIDPNMPPQELLEEMGKRGQMSKEEVERLKKLSDQKIREAISQKIKIINEQNQIKAQAEKVQSLKTELEGKKVYVKVTQKNPPPTPDPKVESMRAEAVAFPRKFIETTTHEYEVKLQNQKLSPIERKLVAQRAAITTYKSLIGKSPIIEAAKVQAIANSEVLQKVVETPPETQAEGPREATRPEGVTGVGFQPLRIPEAPETPEIKTSTLPKDAFQKQIESQDILRQVARNRFSMQMSQLELYKQFVEPAKVDGFTSLDQLKVEVSLTPQQGFEEVDIGRDIVTPHLNSIAEQNDVLDVLNLPVEVGTAEVKQQLLLRVGQRISAEIAELPADSVFAQAYNSQVVQAGLSYVGLTVPSTWVAVEGSWVGNLLVSSGYGPVAGFIQSATGLNLGIMQVLPTVEMGGISGGISLVGTETALTIGGDIAGTAVAGSVATGTAATVAGAATTAEVSLVAGGVAATGAATGGTAAALGTEAVVSAAAAPLSGGASLLIGAVVGAITALGPKIKELISNNREKLLVGGLALTAVGFGGGSIAAMGLGATTALAGGAAMVGAGGGFAGMSTFLGGLLVSIFSGFLAISSGAFIATFIGIPVMVIFILLIINSGAFVVPPSLSTLSITNPYISVMKQSNPSGQVGSPQPVTYTVTITAQKDPLVNIAFSFTCTAIKKSGGNIDCSSLEQLPAPPATITPGSPYTFTFTSNYPATYQDSLVTDTITVTALSAAGGSVGDTGSASICFGNCPLDCFAFPSNYWPSNSDAQNLKGLLTAAAATLSSKYPNFAQKACANGTINLCYNPGRLSGNIFGYHEHGGTCDIDFNNKVIPYGAEGALFLLTHEATHHIQRISSSYVTGFKDTVYPSEPSVCSYGGNDLYETMAEGNALYVARPTLDAHGACITNYATQYPLHYNFAKNCMFGTTCP